MRLRTGIVISVLVAGLGFSFALAGEIVSFSYRVSDWGVGCRNANTEGGETSEEAHQYSTQCIETSNGAHPQSLGGPPCGDSGLFDRGASCTTSWDMSDLMSAPFDVLAGEQIVFSSAWVQDPVATPYTSAGFMSTSDWEGHIVIGSGVLDGDGNVSYAFGPVTFAETLIGTYDAASSSVVTAPHPTSGMPNWMHLEFTADPVPLVSTDPLVNNLGVAVVTGWCVFRSDVEPATSTPSDYATGAGMDFTNVDAPIFSDGTPVPDSGGAQASGLTAGGNYFFNDSFITVSTTNYAVVPVLAAGGGWLYPGAVIYMPGASWYPLGVSGPPASSMSATPVEIAYFEVERNGRNGAVTLNWRTGSEADIMGFLITRKFRLNGRDRGRSIQITPDMIMARGQDGSDYSFTDNVRLPSSLRRGRALTIIYELEIVRFDGTSEMDRKAELALGRTR